MAHRQLATAEQRLTRGVWLAPYRFEGSDVLIAVDSRGDVRKHTKLSPGLDEVQAVRALEQLLERIDPLPQLRLVKPGPTPRPSMLPAEPNGWEDHLSWALRRARAQARQFVRVRTS